MAGFGDQVVTLAMSLQGHDKAITGIGLPGRGNQLYTASIDGTVRIWDCNTGRCIRVLDLGCPVWALISDGPWVFCAAGNLVRARNIDANSEFSLDGPAVAQVCVLVFEKEMLFAGTDQGDILMWKANHGRFQFISCLKGHTASVVCLRVGSGYTKLYSGSEDRTIKVWDLDSLQCLATLTGHSDVVTSLICWDQFLISTSMDCTIKVWHMTETGNFNLEVIYTHDVEQGIIALFGMHDGEVNPVLICSSTDISVRIYDLPSFAQRFVTIERQEVRVMHNGGGGLFFSGDAGGHVSVWKWLEPAVKVRGDKRIALRKRAREGIEGPGWQPNKHICTRLIC